MVGDDSTPLPQADLPLPSLSSPSSPYCCTNSSSSATFLQVLGTSCFSSWREVTDFRKLCNWSPWVNGTCKVRLILNKQHQLDEPGDFSS